MQPVTEVSEWLWTFEMNVNNLYIECRSPMYVQLNIVTVVYVIKLQASSSRLLVLLHRPGSLQTRPPETFTRNKFKFSNKLRRWMLNKNENLNLYIYIHVRHACPICRILGQLEIFRSSSYFRNFNSNKLFSKERLAELLCSVQGF